LPTSKPNLGKMLLDFFNFFGNVLDYSSIEISPNLPHDKPKYPFPNKKMNFLELNTQTTLVINDP